VDKERTYPQEKLLTGFDQFYLPAYTGVIKWSYLQIYKVWMVF